MLIVLNIRMLNKPLYTAVNLRIRHLRDGIYGWNGGGEDFDMNNRGLVTRFKAISQGGVTGGIPGGFTWIISDNTDVGKE